MLITQKRKKIFDKLMKNEKKNNKSKDIKNEKEKEKAFHYNGDIIIKNLGFY